MGIVNNVEDVRKLKGDLYSYYGASIRAMAEADTYYNVSYKIKTMKDFEPYKPATARRKVMAAVDHFMSIGRRVIVPPWGKTEKVLATSERLEKWGKNTLDMTDRMSTINPTRVNATHSMLYGMWVRRGPVFVKSAWPTKPSTLGMSKAESARVMNEWEKQRMFAFPFRAIPVNPQNFLPDPNLTNPQYVIEFSQRMVANIKQEFPNWKTSKSDTTAVEFIAYWDNDKYIILADKDVLTGGFMKNPMGFIPYTWGYSGFGNVNAIASPEEIAVGMVGPAISSLRAEARGKTAMLTHTEAYSYGEPTISQNMGNDLIINRGIGELSIKPDYYNYRVDRPPELSSDVWRYMAMINADSDRSMTSQVLEGQGNIGDDSGYMRAISIGQARLMLEGTVSSIELAEGYDIGRCGILVRDVLQSPVTLYGFPPTGGVEVTEVTPDDFKDSPVFFVKMDGQTPEQIDRRMRIGLEAWSQKALSKQTIIKDFFGKDWTTERNQMLLEKIMETPEVLQPMALALMKALKADELLKELQAATKLGDRVNQPAAINPVNPDMFLKQKRLDQLGKPQSLNSLPEATPL
jgi:hypothetical protein